MQDTEKEDNDEEKEQVVADNLHEVMEDVSQQDQEAANVMDEGQPNDPEFFTNNQALKNQNMRRRLTNEEKNDFMIEAKLVRKSIKAREKGDVKFEDFKMLFVLGRGAFGKVYLGELKTTGEIYAVKSIRKDILIEMDQIENTVVEKDILFECDHPNLVGMEFMFHSDYRIHFVMPFIRGGELYKIYQSKKRFNEKVVRFYAS